MKELTNAIARNFEGCSRDQLNEFAEQMDLPVQDNWKDKTIVNKLLEKLGKLPNEPEDAPPLDTGPAQQPTSETPAEPTEDMPAFMLGKKMPSQLSETGMSREDLMALLQLNLSPSGIWQGRRRLIQITKPEGMKGVQPHPFTWAGNQIMVPWGVKVSVPYPHYEIAMAKYKEIVQRRTQDSKGSPIIVNEYVSVERFRTSDMGDDPQTMNLPVSQKHQFRLLATNLAHFEKTPRRMLARIARRMRVKYARDTETEDIRFMILEKLGFNLDDLFDESADDLV